MCCRRHNISIYILLYAIRCLGCSFVGLANKTAGARCRGWYNRRARSAGWMCFDLCARISGEGIKRTRNILDIWFYKKLAQHFVQLIKLKRINTNSNELARIIKCTSFGIHVDVSRNIGLCFRTVMYTYIFIQNNLICVTCLALRIYHKPIPRRVPTINALTRLYISCT